jgi:radical SAM protein with 4Fe4S-binding SPASM domain
MTILLLLLADQEISERLLLMVEGFSSHGAHQVKILECPTDGKVARDSRDLLDRARAGGIDVPKEGYTILLSQESLDLPGDVLSSIFATFTMGEERAVETALFVEPFTGLRTRALFLKGDPALPGPGTHITRHSFSKAEKKRMYEHYFSRPHFPDTIFLEVTNRCNLRCIMCPCHGQAESPPPGLSQKEQAFMEPSLFRRVLEELSARKEPLTLVPQFRGESCLHAHFPDFLRQAKEKGLSLSLNTNATCFTEQIVEALIDSVDSLFVSLDAIKPGTFEKIRRGARYTTVMENMGRLLDRRRERDSRAPIIYTSFVLIDENRGELEEFLAYWQERVEGVMVYQPRDIEGSCASFFPGRPSEGRGPCYNVTSSAAIMVDGRVVPCCNDNTGISVFGNIKEKSLEEIYNSPGYQRFRLAHGWGHYDSLPLCRKCDVWRWHQTIVKSEGSWMIHENPPSRLYIRM